MTSHTDQPATAQSRLGRLANAYAKAHGHLETDDADTWRDHLAGMRAVLAALDGEWSDTIGEGDGVTMPAMTPEDFQPLWRDVLAAAKEHDECPEWCDHCTQWERPRSCARCKGSGCGPGTALGAYEPCDDCGGDGRDHEAYGLSGAADTTETA